VTLASIDNAFILDVAMGGSTNTVLHTLALAHEAGVPYDLKRLNAISKRTPCVCKVSPSRPDVHMEDVYRVGGVAAILKEVARADVGLDTAAPTVTGTLADLLKDAPAADGDVIRPVANPVQPDRRPGRAVWESRSPGQRRQDGGGRRRHDDLRGPRRDF
jgi:dihydroxy-acid dehydratase